MIQDPAGLTLGTAGTVTVAGNTSFTAGNTYTGPTVVSSGALYVGNANALQNTASVTGSSGATIQLAGGLSLGIPLTLSGLGASGQTGVLVNTGGYNLVTGPITLAAASTISSNSGFLALSSTISGNQNLTLGGAGLGEIPGTVAIGSGTLSKAGTGVWSLDQTPSLGAISLNAGTLSVNTTAMLSGVPLAFNGGSLRITGTTATSLAGITANWTAFNGGLEIPSPAANIAMGQALSGTGALTKLGAGVLSLNGTVANTYSGATNVNGGTLALDFSNLGTPTNLIGSSSTLNLGGGVLTLKGKGAGSTSQTFNGVILNSGGGSILADPNNGTGTTVALGTITGVAAGGSLLAGPAPGAGTGSVTFTTAGAPGPTGIYGGRVVFTDNVNYDWAGTASGSAPYTLGGYAAYSALASSGTDTNNSRITTGAVLSPTGGLTTNTLKIENPAASQALDLGAGTLALTGGGLLATGSNAFTIQNGTLTGGTGAGAYDLVVHQFNSGGLNISASIANSGTNATALTKAGSGTLTLSGNLAATGNVSVNAGRLALTPGSYPIASGAARTISIVPGATLELNATAGTNFLPTDSGQALTISGGGTLVKTGAGTMVLCNANTSGVLAMGAGGLIDVQGGTLQPTTNNHGNMSSNQASINIAAGATFNAGEISPSLDALTGAGTYIDGYGAVTTTIGVANGSGTFSGIVQNSALSIVKVGLGTQVFSGSCTYGGSTTIDGGTLQFGAGGVTGNLPYFTTSATDVTGLAGATLAFNRSDSITIYNAINGGLGVTQNGAGMLTIAQVSLYTGPTLVNSGTLQIGNGNSGRISPSSAVTVAPGATLAVNLGNNGAFANAVTDSGKVAANGSNTNTISGVISGSGGFTQLGTGLTSITGSNSYTGPTVITAGTLSIGNGGSIGSTSSISVGADAALGFNRPDNYGGNWSIPLSGSGGVTLSSGTLTLSGSNAYSGATTLAGGVLNLGNAHAISNSTLTASGSNLVTFSGGIGAFTLGGLTSGTGVSIALTDAASQPVALTVGGNNSSTTYSGGLTGSGTLVKVGTGTLSLDTKLASNGTGAFTYSGGTYVLAGTLKYGSSAGNGISNKLGTGTVYLGDVSGSANATLQQIYNTDSLPNSIVVQSGNTGTATIRSSGGNDVYNGTITLGSPNANGKGITFADSGLTFWISGVIRDAVGLTPGTAGTVTVAGNPIFNAANTYTGPTVVSSGILTLANVNALQSTASVTGSSGASILMQGGLTVTAPLTLSGSGAAGQAGALVNTSGYNAWTAPITLAGASNIASTSGRFILPGTVSGNQDLTLGGAANGDLSGAIALGSGTLHKAGAGVWSLGGTNSTSAASLEAGTLSVSSDSALGGAAAALNFNGGTLRIVGTGLTSLDNHTINWSSGGFDIKDSGANFTVSQALSGTGGFTKSGAGTLTFNGSTSHSYNGATTVNGGTLALDFANLPGATNLIYPSSTLNVGGGGALTIKAASSGATSQSFGGLNIASGGGAVLVNPNNGAGATVSLGALTGAAAGGSLLVGTAVGAGTGSVAIATDSSPDFSGAYGARVVFADGSATGFDWASGNWGGANYILSAYTGYNPLSTGGADSNNSLINASTTLADAVTTNSLKIENPAALQVLALGGTTLALSGGGLLATGSNAFTISGGTLTGGNGTGAYDIVVQQFNTGGLNISAVIADSGSNSTALTKAGPGALTLSGSLAATGNIAVNAGRLTLASGAYPIATGTARTISINAGATLELNATAALSYLPANGGQALTISGNGTLVKTGTGTMVLANANTIETLAMSPGGLIDVQGGTLLASTNFKGGMSNNQASINVVAGATFNSVEIGVSLDALTGAGIFEGGYAAFPVTATIGVANGSGIFSGIVQNYGAALSILKLGTGTQVFSGSNTYTGTTTIDGGLLQIGSGGTTGSLSTSSAISGLIGATLAYNRSDAVTVSNAITGGLGFSQSGSGTLTLTGNNTYTGATTVNSGTLQIGNGTAGGIAASSPVTVSPGGALAIDLAGGVTFANTVTDNGSVAVTGTGITTVSGVLSGAGSFKQSGSGFTLLSGSNSYSGGTTLNSGTLSVAGDANLGGSTTALTFNGGVLQVTGSAIASAGRSIAWSGGGGGFDIAVANLTFTVNQALSGTGGLSKFGAGALALGGSNSFTGPTNFNGGTLRLNNANALCNSTLTASGSNALGFNSGIGTFNLGGLASGTGVLIALTDAASQPVTLTVGSNNANTTFGGGLTGAGTLFKTGTGTLYLDQNLPSGGTGTSTYSGGTVIQAGTLEFGTYNNNNMSGLLGSGTITLGGAAGSANATLVPQYGSYYVNNPIVIQSGNSGASTISNNGGWLTVNGSITLGSPDSAGHGVTLSGVTSGGNWINGVIQDPAGLIPGTAGTVTINTPFSVVLNAANTYTGPTVLTAGNLSVNNANALGSGALTVNGGTLNLNGNSATVGALSGSGGTITNTGGGTSRLTTTVESGVSTYAGTIADGTGHVALTKQGAGSLTLLGNNSYAGATTINSGTLQLGNGGTTGELSPASAIVNNATLAFDRSDTVTQGAHFAATISGSGNIVQMGTGTTVLSGSNSYSGGSTVSSGTLQIGNAHALGAGGLTVNGGALDLHGNSVSVPAFSGAGGVITNTVSGTSTLTAAVAGGTSTYAGNIANGTGAVALTKSESGTLVLGGSVTMAGLNANVGTVQLAQSGSIGAIAIAAGATVALANHAGSTYNVLDSSSLTLAGSTSTLDIASSAAFADPSVAGVLVAMVYDNSAAQVDLNHALLKLTYVADFDADGLIDSSDYALLDTYAQAGSTLGDLTGDGLVDSSDYGLLDTGYQNQVYGVLAGSGGAVAQASTAASAAAPTSPEAVPEPGTLGLLLAGAMGLLGRRATKKSFQGK